MGVGALGSKEDNVIDKPQPVAGLIKFGVKEVLFKKVHDQRIELRVMLAGATRSGKIERERRVEGGEVEWVLADFCARKLSGLQGKVGMLFQIGGGYGKGWSLWITRIDQHS